MPKASMFLMHCNANYFFKLFISLTRRQQCFCGKGKSFFCITFFMRLPPVIHLSDLTKSFEWLRNIPVTVRVSISSCNFFKLIFHLFFQGITLLEFCYSLICQEHNGFKITEYFFKQNSSRGCIKFTLSHFFREIVLSFVCLQSFVPSFVPPLVHSFVRSFLRYEMLVRCFVPSFLCSFVPSFLLPLVSSFLRSLVPSFLRFFVPSYLNTFLPSWPIWTPFF